MKARRSSKKPNAAEARSMDERHMQMAFKEAMRSVAEDAAVHPKVGAVLVRDGKILARAHRGESGPGDHAEFTLLEKKLGRTPAAGAILFTTLEPCSRRSPKKVPCADRIVERKIGRVVIGMLDPNPVISGKGVEKLRRANIVVDTFHPEIASRVEDLNREFSRQYDTSRLTTALLSDLGGISAASTGDNRESEYRAIRARAAHSIFICGLGMSKLSTWAKESLRTQASKVPIDILMLDPEHLVSDQHYASVLEGYVEVSGYGTLVRSSFEQLRDICIQNNRSRKNRRMRLRAYSTINTVSAVIIDENEATASAVFDVFLYRSGDRRPVLRANATGSGAGILGLLRERMRALWNDSREVVS